MKYTKLLSVLLVLTSAGLALAQDPWNQDLNAYQITLRLTSEDSEFWYVRGNWSLEAGAPLYSELGLQLWTFQMGSSVTSVNYPINVGFNSDQEKISITSLTDILSGEQTYAIPKGPSLQRGHTHARFNVYGILEGAIKGRDRSSPLKLASSQPPALTDPTATHTPGPPQPPTSTPTAPPVFSTPTRTATPRATSTPTKAPTPAFNRELQVPSSLSVKANSPVFGQFRFAADTREPIVRFGLWSAAENSDGSFGSAVFFGALNVASSQARKTLDVPVGSSIMLNRIYAFSAESSRDGSGFSAPAISEIFAPGPNYFESRVDSNGITVSWPKAGSKTQLLLWRIIYDAYGTQRRSEAVNGSEVFLTSETSYTFSANTLALQPGHDYFVMVISWLGWDRSLPLSDQSTGVMTNALWTPAITYQAGAFPRSSVRAQAVQPWTELVSLTEPQDRYQEKIKFFDFNPEDKFLADIISNLGQN